MLLLLCAFVRRSFSHLTIGNVNVITYFDLCEWTTECVCVVRCGACEYAPTLPAGTRSTPNHVCDSGHKNYDSTEIYRERNCWTVIICRGEHGRWFAAKAPSQTIIIIIHIEIIFFVYGPYFICGMILDITPPAQDTHGQQKKNEPDSNLTLIATWTHNFSHNIRSAACLSTQTNEQKNFCTNKVVLGWDYWPYNKKVLQPMASADDHICCW